jgi:hypothetical protein
MQISMLQNFLMREGNLRTGERVPKFSLQGPRLKRISVAFRKVNKTRTKCYFWNVFRSRSERKVNKTQTKCYFWCIITLMACTCKRSRHNPIQNRFSITPKLWDVWMFDFMQYKLYWRKDFTTLPWADCWREIVLWFVHYLACEIVV